jgi:hypothetical protein
VGNAHHRGILPIALAAAEENDAGSNAHWPELDAPGEDSGTGTMEGARGGALTH